MTHHPRLWKRSISIPLAFVAALFFSACTLAGPTSTVGDEVNRTAEVATQTAAETNPLVKVTPVEVAGGTLVAVTGSGWRPDAEVYINLETADLPELNGTFAVARAAADGRFNISFYFPTDERWRQIGALLLVARSPSTTDEAAVPMAVRALDAPGAPADTPAAIADTPAATAVPARVTGLARVTGQQVNLRLGPSTDYPVVKVFTVGTILNISGQNSLGDWLRVRLPEGNDGWILRLLTDFSDNVPVLAAPPLARATPDPVISEWRGEYYANPTLEGTPALVRNDANVRFNWGFSAPSAGFPTDGFSARWTRSLPFAAGTYNFFAHVDDGVRIWLDNNLIVDAWREQSPKTHTGSQVLNEGTHLVRIEYVEVGEKAEIDFWWERTGDFNNWQAEYFSNRQLAGSPAMVRDDAAIDFDWGEGAPAPGLPADDFSVRWTRSLEFAPGLYRFHAKMDDAFRLFINGTVIFDRWLDGGEREVVADVRMPAGVHALRAEHYERSGAAIAQLWWEQMEPSTPFLGWKGEYWPNDMLEGDPTLVRDDPVINFDWGTSTPGFGIPDDRFSVRWTRRVQLDSGTYRFFVNADDGVRLWVGSSLLVDRWTDGPADSVAVDAAVASGLYDLRVEYVERSGDARVQVRWEKLQPLTNFPNWQGEYFSNQDLQGVPVLVRNDPEINFNWKLLAPATALPSDRFSARWTRALFFEKGRYRLYARADDGLRISVDGNTVLDRWHGSDGTEVYMVDVDLDGTHRLAVEYFENLDEARVEFWWQRVE